MSASAITMRVAAFDAQTNEPLIGAAINTYNADGTLRDSRAADIDGNALIDVAEDGTISISYVGYYPVKVRFLPEEIKKGRKAYYLWRDESTDNDNNTEEK